MEVHPETVADLRAQQAAELIELRKREIIVAATRLFAENGYHQTSIADIAGHLSIGHGTIYRYFENKRAILDRILDDLYTRLLETALTDKAPDAARTLDEYRGQIEHFARTFWGLYDSDPAVRMLLRHTDNVDPQLSRRVTAFLTAAARVVAGYLENGRSRGFLAAGIDTEATARTLVALVFGSLLCAREPIVGDRERYTRSAVSVIFNGIAAG